MKRSRPLLLDTARWLALPVALAWAAQRIAQANRAAGTDRLRELALQAYLDRMAALLEQGLDASRPGDSLRRSARAYTMAVLRNLDGVRKAALLQFLYEAGLIGGLSSDDEPQAPIIALKMANLRQARLDHMNLGWASLIAADLTGADLRGAYLARANLSGADLIDADLRGAVLTEANLFLADLRGARLQNADLSGARVSAGQLAAAR